MLTYSNAEEEFSHAAYLLSQAAQVLDRIAKNDRAIWERFEARLCVAGADRIEKAADECDLISHLITLEARGPSAAADRLIDPFWHPAKRV
jgi:hypothetical protein